MLRSPYFARAGKKGTLTWAHFRGWVRVRVLGYGFGVRGRTVKSRDCALASDSVKATDIFCQEKERFCCKRVQPGRS